MSTQPEIRSSEAPLERWLRRLVRVHFLFVVATTAFGLAFALGMFAIGRCLPTLAAWFERYFAGAMALVALAGLALSVIGVLTAVFGYVVRRRSPPSLLIRCTCVAILLVLDASLLGPAL